MDENINDSAEGSQTLNRRDRKKLAKLERQSDDKKSQGGFKWAWGLLISILIIGVLYLLFNKYTKPLPGEEVTDLGREHVTDIAGVNYSSNPPTSGPHFTVWAKPGAYDRLISDGHMIHSLEHGYIVISYDCTKPLTSRGWSLVRDAYAHDEPAEDSTDSGQLLKHLKFVPKEGESWITPQNQPEIEVELPEEFKSESCKNLASKLSEFLRVKERVIVVPRVGMDTPIALTAWGRILKLDKVDDRKIKEFINAYHNRGPEKTME